MLKYPVSVLFLCAGGLLISAARDAYIQSRKIRQAMPRLNDVSDVRFQILDDWWRWRRFEAGMVLAAALFLLAWIPVIFFLAK